MSKTKTSSAQKLFKSLHKEIHLLREVLTNLHQEELALLEHAHARWSHVMEHRSDFVAQLRRLRLKREKLELEEDLSIETLHQLDQLFALIERINLQNCRNDALFDQMKGKAKAPLSCAYPHPLKRKRKPSIATYQGK